MKRKEVMIKKIKYRSSGLSNAEIVNLANIFKLLFKIESSASLDVIWLLERVLPNLSKRFYFRIGKNTEFKDGEYAYTDLLDQQIVIKDDVYQGARKKHGWCRMTIMHGNFSLIFYHNLTLDYFLLRKMKKLELLKILNGKQPL